MPEDNDVIRSRAIWSGTITFGLVSVPVNLFPGNRQQRVSLRMLDEDGTPLARRYYCPQEDREIDGDEVARGFEVEDGRFIIIEDEELEAIEPRKSRDIDLRQFVPVEQVDPIFFERAYFLVPDGSNKAYRLLAETMERTGRAGIATFVMRDKEYLVAIIAEKGILRAETLRFADEIRAPSDAGLPELRSPATRLVRKIEQDIAKRSEARLSTTELKDRHAERLIALAEKKRKKHEDVVEVPVEAEEAEGGAEIIDLVEILRRSMSEREARGRTAKRTGTRRAATGRARKTASAGGGRKASAGARKSTRKRARQATRSGGRTSGARKTSRAGSSTSRRGTKKAAGRSKAA